MSYQVIARKYRPQRFADVVGQEHVTQTLANAIRQHRIAHAYLFVGPRGTGKTTIARIFAKCLNCTGGPLVDFAAEDPRCREISEGRSLDVLEIDGASNRGIEEIRELRETVKFAPSNSKFKIYIIDEVHMLTKEAFNALLKTLEEPPEHVKFMFATTEPEKVLPTILSRCQRYDLRRIPVVLIVKHLGQIAQLEGVKVEEPALYAIARGAEGCMRDAESTLDQLISFCGSQIVEADVLSMFGLAAREQIQSLAGATLEGDVNAVLRGLDELARNGKDLGRLLSDLLNHFRNLLLFQITKGDQSLLEVSEVEAARIAEQAKLANAETLARIMDVLVDAEARLRDTMSKKTLIEVTLVKAAQAKDSVSVDFLIKQLQKLRGGEAVSLPVPASIARSHTTPAQPIRKIETPAAPVVQNQQAPPPAMAEQPSPPPPATARPPTPAAASDLDALWASVVESVGKVSGFTRSYLQNGHAIAFDGRLLTIGFTPEFADQIDLVDNPKNRKIIQEQLRELGQGDVEVKIMKTQGVGRTTPQPPAPPAPKSQAAAPAAPSLKPESAHAQAEARPAKAASPALSKEDFKNDPLIKQALEIFKGQLVEVKS